MQASDKPYLDQAWNTRAILLMLSGEVKMQ